MAAAGDLGSAVGGGAPVNHLHTPDFPVFDPFLLACSDYAELTGYRFRGRLFKVHCGDDGETADNVEPCSAALRNAAHQAAPVVTEFAQRLQEGEELLLDSAERAYRLVMGEGIRNGMVATLRELSLWPPMPPPPGVQDGDCAYEDTSAPLPMIAQRAWNDEKRREALMPFHRRLSSASFVVDFASELGGVSAPDLSETHSTIMDGFMARVDEWEHSAQEQGEELASGTMRGWRALLGGLTTRMVASVFVAVFAFITGYVALRYGKRLQE